MSNKAAERLWRWEFIDEAEFAALLDKALATERRAGALAERKRIREANAASLKRSLARARKLNG